MDFSRQELESARSELMKTKELYVEVCKEKELDREKSVKQHSEACEKLKAEVPFLIRFSLITHFVI